MVRARYGVALLIPPPLGREIDGLRRACGDRQLERIPPHLTLVPPVNVRGDAIPAALRLLRDAAAKTARDAPLSLDLGPPATFGPESETVYLSVSGPSVDALVRLRERVFRPPLERPIDWPFVPHVTIADGARPGRVAAVLTAMADYRVTAAFDRLYLLEERRDDEGRRRWIPVADAPFVEPAIVGRGGIELELTATSLCDPEAMVLLASAEVTPDDVPAGASPLVITARRRDVVVGVACGWVRHDDDRDLTLVLVRPGMRRQGIGRQLALAFAAAPRQTWTR